MNMLSRVGEIYLKKLMRKKGTCSTECSRNSMPSRMSLSQVLPCRSVKRPMNAITTQMPNVCPWSDLYTMVDCETGVDAHWNGKEDTDGYTSCYRQSCLPVMVIGEETWILKGTIGCRYNCGQHFILLSVCLYAIALAQYCCSMCKVNLPPTTVNCAPRRMAFGSKLDISPLQLMNWLFCLFLVKARLEERRGHRFDALYEPAACS